ncbi:chloride channel protein [ANME-1 cluster archaeon ex4572_4]|nr:MAG: chloride channel protein [ANME-1 cluster archaeon ex4572_4]
MKKHGTSELRHLQQWVLWSVVIGVVAGLGAVAFFLLLQATGVFFQGYLAGYYPSSPAGESGVSGALLLPVERPFRLWVLAAVPAVGGLLAGLLIYTFAPESEGHGTDAVIDAFHNKKGEIRKRVPLVKTLASAVTIGSGGSAGREGPTAQIGAGFGSFLAGWLKLDERERRAMMICGAAAGVGAIFKAPLGGALFGIEVLYKRDFEMESMVPAVVSSVVAYSVFCSFPGVGWGPIFATQPYIFRHPYELVFYALLGVVCAVVGIFYVKVFYGLRDVFKRLKVPRHLKPALGGVLVGAVALAVGSWRPRALDGVLGAGYGFVQSALSQELPLGELLVLMLVVAVVKIFATSFTIGSGGSGGVFAPSLVIGAMLGGFFGGLFHLFFPQVVTELTVSAFVLVGMAAFFSGVAKVPIAAILMISEMAGSYSLLVPLMLTSAVAYTLSGEVTIYEKQETTRRESQAHRREFVEDILEGIKVKDACTKEVLTISGEKTVEEGILFAEETGHISFPVVDAEAGAGGTGGTGAGGTGAGGTGGKMIGITSVMDLEKQREAGAGNRQVKQVCKQEVVVAYPDEFLEEVLYKMNTYNIGRLPVVKGGGEEGEKELVGIISRSDIVREHCRRRSLLRGAED